MIKGIDVLIGFGVIMAQTKFVEVGAEAWRKKRRSGIGPSGNGGQTVFEAPQRPSRRVRSSR